MNIGIKIRQRREELGMTQDELAKKLGYKSRSSVNKVETSREVSMKKIQLYAIALDTTVPYLMGWEEQIESFDKADQDAMLLSMEQRLKEYALRMAKLSKDDQTAIMQMIDRFSK